MSAGLFYFGISWAVQSYYCMSLKGGLQCRNMLMSQGTNMLHRQLVKQENHDGKQMFSSVFYKLFFHFNFEQT